MVFRPPQVSASRTFADHSGLEARNFGVRTAGGVPDYTSAARDLNRTTPDVRAMRFIVVSVGQVRADGINRASVERGQTGAWQR